jgi:hypothetical protein
MKLFNIILFFGISQSLEIKHVHIIVTEREKKIFVFVILVTYVNQGVEE